MWIGVLHMCGDSKYYARLWKKQAAERKELEKTEVNTTIPSAPVPFHSPLAAAYPESVTSTTIPSAPVPFHRPMRLPGDELESVINKIDDCLTSGQISNKQNVRELENSIKELYDVKYAIATSSASQGLLIALQALYRVYPVRLDSIITPAFAWYSSMYAIETAGKTCCFIDIDHDTWTMKHEPDDMYSVTMPVHTFGNVCEVDSDFTIYDGAHCLGSRIMDFGNATVLSMAPTKIITSIEGGIVLTDDNLLAEKIIAIRDKVSRMSEIHAIFGNAYLQHIDEVTKFKKQVFVYYSRNLKGTFQKTDRHSNHNTVGMLTDLKIPDCIETRKYYEPLGESRIGLLENTMRVYDRIVCLPSYYKCPYEQIVDIINTFNKGD